MEERRRNLKKEELVKLSKFLSLILRHKPEVIGLMLDAQGWADVNELLHKAQASGKNINSETLAEIVRRNEKQRFGFNEDFTKIRARQGHSIAVDLQLQPKTPPVLLYHGTVERNLPSIKEKGLSRQNRQHVHLSEDVPTAQQVGSRYGKPVVLPIEAAKMHAAGHTFFLSENGVWLTHSVEPPYIHFPP